VDERVPKCIEIINNERDAMTQAQVRPLMTTDDH
jgi:hypothetical protein